MTLISIDNAMQLAAQWQRDGQLAQAEEILNRILQSNPTHAHALHLLGVIAHQVGKTTEGIQFIQQAINSAPRVALFHSNLGEMHRQLHAIDLSIKHGRRAVHLDPKSATALSNLGVAYYDAEHYDQAEACHKRALTINPVLCSSLNNMGSLHKKRKNNHEAMSYYRAAIAALPGYHEPLNNLGAVLVIEQHFDEAIDVLSQAIGLSEGFSDAHCNIGFAFLGLDKSDRALIHFQRALQLKPTYAEAYIGLGKVHQATSCLESAEFYTKKALELNPNNAEFYECLASIYGERGETTDALTYFDKALSLDPESSSVLISKGNLLVELGEANAAEALFLQATEFPSTQTQLSAHFSLVQLRAVKPDNVSMEALLSQAANINALSVSQREYLHFGLGKCYDDIHENAKAFHHYAEGCKLKRSRINYHCEEQTQFALRIKSLFTEKSIESLRQSANHSALPIFVLGMPRSGTTLIEQIIASHPDVHGAGELSHLSTLMQRPMGEHRYPENLFHLSNTECRAIADDYIACLQRYSPTSAHITDKMPGNFVAIGLIHALLPNAKIIHVERDPIDTCLSCFTKLFRHGQHFSYDLTELGHYYLNYQRIMNHWRQVLPSDAWLDVRYEQFVTDDLESEARRLLAYCELKWDPACLSFHTNKRQVRTASLTQVRKPIYTSSVERWRLFERELQPLITVLNDPSTSAV